MTIGVYIHLIFIRKIDNVLCAYDFSSSNHNEILKEHERIMSRVAQKTSARGCGMYILQTQTPEFSSVQVSDPYFKKFTEVSLKYFLNK